MKKLFKLSVLLIGLAIMLVTGLRTHAQNATTIKYGDAIVDELTTAVTQKQYTFTGKKGDIVILETTTRILNGSSYDYSNVDISMVVTDSIGAKLIDSGTYYGPHGAALLPGDGTYNVLITTRKDASKDSLVGKYQLILSLAQPLKIGASVNGSTGLSTPHYYLIPPDQPFTLNFSQKIKDNNYIQLQFFTIYPPSSTSMGQFSTEPLIPTRDMNALTLSFDKKSVDSQSGLPGVLLQLSMYVYSYSKAAPVDFHMALQNPQSSAAVATMAATAVHEATNPAAATVAATVKAAGPTATKVATAAATATTAATAAATTAAVATAPATTNTGLAGAYKVTGKNADGSGYQATMTIAQTGNVYTVSKKAASTIPGIGILQGNMLVVGFGAQCGVLSYLVKSNDELAGVWGVVGMQPTGTENGTRSGPFSSLEGIFDVSGTLQNGTAYKGKLILNQSGSTYQETWTTGNPYQGVGIERGNVLGVGFGAAGCGIAVYQLQADGSLDGQLAVVGQPAQTGTEKAVKS